MSVNGQSAAPPVVTLIAITGDRDQYASRDGQVAGFGDQGVGFLAQSHCSVVRQMRPSQARLVYESVSKKRTHTLTKRCLVYDFLACKHPIDSLETRADAGAPFTTLFGQNNGSSTGGKN